MRRGAAGSRGLGQGYLQWTTMGPASGGLQVLTLRRKARKGVGYSGTPWSGHAVNWNCRTSRFSLEPFWGPKGHRQSPQPTTHVLGSTFTPPDHHYSERLTQVPG